MHAAMHFTMHAACHQLVHPGWIARLTKENRQSADLKKGSAEQKGPQGQHKGLAQWQSF